MTMRIQTIGDRDTFDMMMSTLGRLYIDVPDMPDDCRTGYRHAINRLMDRCAHDIRTGGLPADYAAWAEHESLHPARDRWYDRTPDQPVTDYSLGFIRGLDEGARAVNAVMRRRGETNADDTQ